MTRDRCRSCDAPIFWALTATGKRMPLDWEPVEDGIVTIVTDDDEHHLVTVHRDPPDDWPRYTSHFATCPQPAVWRRRPVRG